ncbi:MAG: NADP-dependent phosphogluconate dehydrogenase [Fimbriimonadaceae bacterium]|nr:NADP-dependent phosphogluconate dehydrogenase [Fimbriimonadaceae bacterium]
MKEFGVIGLGRIGGGLALQALGKGYRVVGLDVVGASDELRTAGLVVAGGQEDLVAALDSPRVVFLYIHAGPPVDVELDRLSELLAPGDIVLDGGNSYWGDSKVRAARLAEHGIRLLDLGTSGGLPGARNGACFMAGGEPDAYRVVEPILADLAVPGGLVYCGPSGAGHFVKLVHNGIEFGMLQAIGEGLDLLEKYPDDLPITAVLGCWRNGSVVRSWLVDLLHEAMQKPPSLDEVPGYIEDTGEVNWLIEDALHMEVPVPVIAQSVMQLFASRDDRRAWARAIAMMRHGFGGHPYGPHEGIRAERRTSRVGLRDGD